MLNPFYTSLCFFMSQVHFLIHYTHNVCSKYDEILEMSVNTLAKKHKLIERRQNRRKHSCLFRSELLTGFYLT